MEVGLPDKSSPRTSLFRLARLSGPLSNTPRGPPYLYDTNRGASQSSQRRQEKPDMRDGQSQVSPWRFVDALHRFVGLVLHLLATQCVLLPPRERHTE